MELNKKIDLNKLIDSMSYNGGFDEATKINDFKEWAIQFLAKKKIVYYYLKNKSIERKICVNLTYDILEELFTFTTGIMSDPELMNKIKEKFGRIGISCAKCCSLQMETIFSSVHPEFELKLTHSSIVEIGEGTENRTICDFFIAKKIREQGFKIQFSHLKVGRIKLPSINLVEHTYNEKFCCKPLHVQEINKKLKEARKEKRRLERTTIYQVIDGKRIKVPGANISTDERIKNIKKMIKEKRKGIEEQLGDMSNSFSSQTFSNENFTSSYGSYSEEKEISTRKSTKDISNLEDNLISSQPAIPINIFSGATFHLIRKKNENGKYIPIENDDEKDIYSFCNNLEYVFIIADSTDEKEYAVKCPTGAFNSESFTKINEKIRPFFKSLFF